MPKGAIRRDAKDAHHAQALQRDFGERLRWLRLAWEEREPGRHSQEQWAEALGVNIAAVSRWERGVSPMPPDMVWRVVMAMDATWDYLFGGLIGPGMEPWLAAHLRKRYPKAIVEQKALRSIRDKLLASMRLRRFRVPKRLGRPPRRGIPLQRSDALRRRTPESQPID